MEAQYRFRVQFSRNQSEDFGYQMKRHGKASTEVSKVVSNEQPLQAPIRLKKNECADPFLLSVDAALQEAETSLKKDKNQD